MNKKQAEEKMYQFTGIYERTRDEAIDKMKDRVINKGYKAVIVTVKDNPLNRGPKGEGYSVYAEEKYFVNERIESLKIGLNNIKQREDEAFKMYQKTINEIAKDRDNWREQLEADEKYIKELK